MSRYHEPCESLADALSKIENLNGYFAECAASGQGINSKESIWMRSAMLFALNNGAMPHTLMDMATDDTAACCLAAAMRQKWPNIGKLFATESAT